MIMAMPTTTSYVRNITERRNAEYHRSNDLNVCEWG